MKSTFFSVPSALTFVSLASLAQADYLGDLFGAVLGKSSTATVTVTQTVTLPISSVTVTVSKSTTLAAVSVTATVTKSVTLPVASVTITQTSTAAASSATVTRTVTSIGAASAVTATSYSTVYISSPCSSVTSPIVSLPSTSSPKPSTTSPSSPSATGWVYSGCYLDDVNARTLANRVYVTGSMTQELCFAACKSAGYSIAGLEFYSECYCDNMFENGVTSPATDNACVYPCDGDQTEICGGNNRLSVFQHVAS